MLRAPQSVQLTLLQIAHTIRALMVAHARARENGAGVTSSHTRTGA